jgi:hypothetical protein
MERDLVVDRGIGGDDRRSSMDRMAFRGANKDAFFVLLEGLNDGIGVEPPLLA